MQDQRRGSCQIARPRRSGAAFFKPNLVFLTAPASDERREDLKQIIAAAPSNGLGIALFADHPLARTGRRKSINVWFPPRELEKQDLSSEVGEMDLALLLAYRINSNWTGRVRLLTHVAAERKGEATDFLRNVPPSHVSLTPRFTPPFPATT